VNSFGRPTQMATTATPKEVAGHYPERGIGGELGWTNPVS
jgi:hypothetical protein